MATVLVQFTADNDQSDPQTVGNGEVHTLIPIFAGRPGRVEVYLVNADDGLVYLKTLPSRPKRIEDWQIEGPAEYVVKVKNAGCDVEEPAEAP